MNVQHELPVSGEPETCKRRSPRNKRLKLEKLFRLCRQERRGAAVVEFAIVAPVFFAFTLGMIEVGRAVMVQQIITSASREGARQAVLNGATQSSVTTYINNYMSSASISATPTVGISPSLPTASGYAGPVTVTVSIPFSQVSWSPSPIFLNGSTLTASTTMQSEAMQ